MDAIRLTYLFDPLCGWCYGAAPAITRLRAAGLSVEMVPVGLFAGSGAFAMSEGFARHAWDADQRIATLTGQPFSEAYRTRVLAQRGNRVDSGPATLALTAVRLTEPQREAEALEAIQRARYVDGLDNSVPDVIAGVLTTLGLDAALRRFEAAEAELVEANRARIEAGRATMRAYRLRGGAGAPDRGGPGSVRCALRSERGADCGHRPGPGRLKRSADSPPPGTGRCEGAAPIPFAAVPARRGCGLVLLSCLPIGGRHLRTGRGRGRVQVSAAGSPAHAGCRRGSLP